MNINELRGCGTALVTPFRDGQVDYDAFAALVDYQIKGGVDFLVPLGTTGETPCLTDYSQGVFLRKAGCSWCRNKLSRAYDIEYQTSGTSRSGCVPCGRPILQQTASGGYVPVFQGSSCSYFKAGPSV